MKRDLDIQKLHEEHIGGKTLRKLAAENEISHETLRQKFLKAGLHVRTRKESWDNRRKAT